MISAVWVGGPPGATLLRLIEKLRGDGIDVFDVQERFHVVPSAADLVLVNIDMASHNSFNAARAAAGARNVRVVAVRTNYSRSRRALMAAGFFRGEEPKKETMTTENEKRSAEKITSQTVDDFLSRVPKDLLPQVKTVLAKRLREDDVSNAVLAVSTLDGDGLTEFLAVLDDEIRLTLRSALGVTA